MAKKTAIQWKDSKHNFWCGFKDVNPGCKSYYMHHDQKSYARPP